MSTGIVRGNAVVVGVEDGVPDVREDAAVLYRDGRVVEVGPADRICAEHPELAPLGEPGDLVLPGFVDAHHHVGVTPFMLGAPDLPLEQWIAERLRSRSVPAYLDTLFGAWDMLRSGITTVHHISGGIFATSAEMAELSEEVLRAYDEVGMRVSYSVGLIDQNRFSYDGDEPFLAALGPSVVAEAEALVGPPRDGAAQLVPLFEGLAGSWDGAAGGRVRVQLAPLNLQWCSEPLLEAVAEASERHSASVHIHLVESRLQAAYAERRFGCSALAALDRFGLVGPKLTVGHGVWLDQDDLDLLADAGGCLCHNPSSNLRLHSGIAPVSALLERGVALGLGIDEAGINDDRDMFAEMRLAAHLQRAVASPAAAPTLAQVFEMATAGGARTTDFGVEIGSLAPGARMDCVLLASAGGADRFAAAETPVVDAVVQRGRRERVHTVLVDGEVVVAGGRLARVDEDAFMAELAELLAAPPSDEEERRGRLADAVLAGLESQRRGARGDV